MVTLVGSKQANNVGLLFPLNMIQNLLCVGRKRKTLILLQNFQSFILVCEPLSRARAARDAQARSPSSVNLSSRNIDMGRH
jgi:hypothetical protein